MKISILRIIIMTPIANDSDIELNHMSINCRSISMYSDLRLFLKIFCVYYVCI